MFKFNLTENENLIAMHRKAEAVLFKPVLIIFAFIYIPWFFLLKYDLLAETKGWLMFWTFIVLLYGANKYVLWMLNVYLITDKRVAAVHYKNVFKKQVIEFPLNHIGGISFKTTGVMSSLFNFGDVEIQPHNLNSSIVFQQVKHPSEIKDTLWQLKHTLSQTFENTSGK